MLSQRKQQNKPKNASNNLPHLAGSHPEERGPVLKTGRPASTRRAGEEQNQHQTVKINQAPLSQPNNPKDPKSIPQQGYFQFHFKNPIHTKLFNTLWAIFWLILLSVTMISYWFVFDTFIGIQVALTVWSYYITTLFILSGLLYTISEPEYNSLRYTLHRVLHTISAVNELIVFVGYWPWAFTEDIPTYDQRCTEVIVCYVFTTVSHLLILIPPWAALLLQKTDVRWSALISFGIINGTYTVVMVSYTLLVSPVYPIYTFTKVIDYVILTCQWIAGILIYWGVLSISRCRRDSFESNLRTGSKNEKNGQKKVQMAAQPEADKSQIDEKN